MHQTKSLTHNGITRTLQEWADAIGVSKTGLIHRLSRGYTLEEALAPLKYNGRTDRPEYRVWWAMIQRCTNESNAQWARYGGRGVTVCARWQASFDNFFADMGPRPDGLTIDRINNDGNYEPQNTRWATRAQQSINKSNNHHIAFNGETLTISQWSRRLGLHVATISGRLRKNLPIDQVLFLGRLADIKPEE